MCKQVIKTKISYVTKVKLDISKLTSVIPPSALVSLLN